MRLMVEWFCFTSPEGVEMVAMIRGQAVVTQTIVPPMTWRQLLQVGAHLRGQLKQKMKERR